MNKLRRLEVLDMVGEFLDEAWIDFETALGLLVEFGEVSRGRAIAMLCGLDQPPAPELGSPADDWTPLREWRDDGSWS